MSAVLKAQEPSARYLETLRPPLVEHFDLVASAPGGVARLRELILTLAVRGKLVPQDANDEPACQLLQRIHAEKDRLRVEGKIKREGVAADRANGPDVLPTGWVWSTLSAIGLINPRTNAPDDSIASFVQMSSIPSAFLAAHAAEPRPWRDIRCGFTQFAEGDVGLAKITPCFENGKSTIFQNLTNGIGAGTTELHVVRPLCGIDPKYVLLFLKTPSFLIEGERVMTGSAGQKRLPRAYFENAPFPLPPLAEQPRIVARVEELMALCDALETKGRLEDAQHGQLRNTLLGTLTDSASPEELTGNWQRIAAHFEQLLDRPEAIDTFEGAILQLAVRGVLVPQGPGESAEVLLERVRNEKAKMRTGESRNAKTRGTETCGRARPFPLPSGWAWARFGDYVLELCTGPFGSLVHKEDYATNGIPLINPSHMVDGRITHDPDVAVSPALAERLSAYRLSAGDVLLARRGEVGRYALVTKDEEGWLCGTGSFFVRLSRDTDRRYFGLMLEDPRLRRHLLGASVGATMTNLNQRILLDAVLAIPPLVEQQRIVARVDQLRRLCAELREKLANAQTTQTRLGEALVDSAVSAD